MKRIFASLAVLGMALMAAPRGEAAARGDLHRIVERVERVKAALEAGRGGEDRRAELEAIRRELEARGVRLEAKLNETESRLRALGLDRALERLASARAALEATQRRAVEALERAHEKPDVLDTDELEECLGVLRPLADSEAEDSLSAQELPLSAPSLVAPPLDKSGGVDTSALDAAAPPSAPVIGAVPEGVRELADTVDGPVAAYELVKSQTRFELYFGSMKGPEQALREASGNDADLNRLLVELLRAKGVPARYVRGVIRISIEQAMNLLGVERPERVEQALAGAGVPYEPVITGVGLSALDLEHVWVEAYVPWSNYRGIALDDRGKRWVPLDASFEPHSTSEGEQVLEAMGFDAEAFVREELQSGIEEDPFAALRQRVTSFLDQSFPGTSFDQALRTVDEVPEVFGLLPASLPYEVVSVHDVSFDFPEELEHRVRFIARTDRGEIVLGNSFVLSSLLGKRLTLSYVAAGAEDQETAGAFGGIYQTPPYLIDVRPVLRSGGLVVETGNPIPMGARFTLTTELATPSGVVTVDNRMIAGAYAALGLSGTAPGYEESSESRAGELLNQRALHYLRRWNEVDAALAGLTRSLVFRPVANHVVVKNHIEVEYAGTGVPLTFEWKGVDVDADLRPTVAVPAGENEGARRDFYLLSGLVGSELESRILEDDLGVRSISTVTLLRLAANVREIDGSNADVELPALGIERDLVSQIEAQVHQGRTVRVPASDVSYLAWTGAGFSAWDPESGESAYILSGRIAGGSTAEPPDQQPQAPVLSNPEESAAEPSRVVAGIEKLSEGDNQEALVDQELPLPIGVYVTDADGNPVADGVPVTFRIVHPGSRLLSMDRLQQGEELTVPTVNGVARLRFQLGTSTWMQPRYVQEKSGDRYLTQVGLYHVTAEAGGVSLAESFFAYAYPDAEEDSGGRHGRLIYITGKHATSFVLNVPPQPMWVSIFDRFGNPLSNLETTFEVLEPERASPLPENYLNAKILDARDREVDSATFVTSYLGVSVFARLGNVDGTRYRFAASREDELYPVEPIEFLRDSDDYGAAATTGPIGEQFAVVFRQKGVHLGEGGELWMGKVGEKLRDTLEWTFVALQEDYKVVQNANGRYALEGLGTFTRREITDATVTPVLLEGDGRFDPPSRDRPSGDSYAFDFTLGKAPGRRTVSEVADFVLLRPYVNPLDGTVSKGETTFHWTSDKGFPIWGVDVAITEQGPKPFVLDGNGHLAPGSALAYRILPLELHQILLNGSQRRILEIREEGKLVAEGPLPLGPVLLSEVNPYDPDKVYQAQVVLLKGTVGELRSVPKQLDFFNAFLTESNPAPILVEEVPDGENPPGTKFVTTKDADLRYFVRPTSLALSKARVDLFEIDRETGGKKYLGAIDGDNLQGDGKAVLPRGFVPDTKKKEYSSELVLEQGEPGQPVPTGPDIRSRPRAVVFSQLLYDVSNPVSVTFVQDSAGGPPCFRAEPITYRLARDADVVISIQRFDPGVNPDAEGSAPVVEREIYRGRQFATVGIERISFTPGPDDFSVIDAVYGFRIQATAADSSGLVEEKTGRIFLVSTGHNVLPVGHTFVKGVDLLDGHLVSSSTDLSIPGRGPALEMVRTYSSSGTDSSGPLGAGWSMNYTSTLIVTDCAWVVVGGDGSGQRFVDLSGRFVPQRGYHTELIRNADGSFDFFTKGRVRYHYNDVALFEGEPLYGGRPTLEFIEDPNGNRVEILYDGQRNIIEAREGFAGDVRGRSLHFSYITVLGEPRISKVEGPLGLVVTYEYDEWGNLVKAARGERVELYEYSVDNPLDRHNLVAYTDPNGNVTRYEYYQEDDVLPGESTGVLVAGKFERVKRVMEPESATTELEYDLTELNDGFYETTVTDARGNAARYKLNLTGSPVRIEEPLGVVTEMVWSSTDIFKTEETDANGRVTDFAYDGNGNLTKQTVHAGGAVGDVVTEYEYHPLFNKMTLKRVHNRDPLGNEMLQETRFVIDDTNGNLEEVTDAEGNVSDYEYYDNGDLRTATGPRPGQVTSFTYDELGNPFTTTDGEGNTTTTVYDERSRLRASDDTFGRSMTQDYDELDRVTAMTRTDSSGASDDQMVSRDYYPGGQLRVETNGLGLATRFELDGLNRVVRTEDDLGNVSTMAYDGNGNVILKADRRGVVTSSGYDELNRLVRVEVSGIFGLPQVVSRFDYDSVGNKLYEIDLHGDRTDFEYDGLYRVTKRLLATTDAVSGARHEESFLYDLVGNKLSERDANGHETVFVYDRLNRLIHRTDAEGNESRFAYDQSGNRTEEEDLTRGLRTTTSYDFLNRPALRVVEGREPDGFRYETSWEYQDSAHEVVETDPRGFRKTTLLDGFDRVREVRQETGSTVLTARSFYDGNGNLKRSVDAENRTTVSEYDGLNRLKKVTDALGQESTFDYDGEGNKTEQVDRRGVPTRFTYDNLGRLVRTTVERALTGRGPVTTSRSEYRDSAHQKAEYDAGGAPTLFTMDGRERVVSVRDALSQEQRFTYDGVNKVEEVDRRGNRTELDYDGLNRLTKVTDALGQTLQSDYRDSARQVVETDKRGIVKTTQLDALGRLVTVTRAGVLLESHEYDGVGNRVLSKDANGNETRFTYDGANRMTERTDGLGSAVEATTTFVYDGVGNLLESKDGRDTGKTYDVRNTYDELNRLKTTEDGEVNVTRYEYDPEGNRTAVVQPKGPEYRTEYVYGERNELLEVDMPDGGIYRYEYDPKLNRTKQTDAEGHVVTFTYDVLNRLDLMIQDPQGFNLVTNHDYDPNGNEVKLVDPKAQRVDFEYDQLNRLKSKVYNLTAADLALYTRTHRIDYAYDANDNLIRVDETKSSGTDPPAAVSSFKTYDSLDRLKSETDAWGRRLEYDYDPQGNRTSLVDPDGKRTTYQYDERNRLETLTLDDSELVRYDYFPDSLKKQVSNPNATTSTYTYDAADRMKTISHESPTGTIAAYTYEYDENGNRKSQLETNAGRTETTLYEYDLVNRLKTVTYEFGTANAKQTTYVYDKVGNRKTEQDVVLQTSTLTKHLAYEYDAINRLESIDDVLGPEDVTYLYDANGNTTSKTKNGITTTFQYDIRDQLGEVQQGSSVLGRYGYDYDGRRILKIGDDGRRQYTYDQLSVITEADQLNATVSKYDYGMDQLVRLDNRGEGTSFFHLDVLRSTVSLTDAAGGDRQSIFYDAWGNERDRIGASANKFTFTGHEKDQETGLLYAKARFLDPEIGRFLSQDSFHGETDAPPSLHRYSYTHANPLRFVDPTGNQAEGTDWAKLQEVSDQYFREGPAVIDIRSPQDYEEPIESRFFRRARFWVGAAWFVATETAVHVGRAIGQEVKGAFERHWGVHEERQFSDIELENRIAIEQMAENQPDYLREDALRSVRLSDQTTGQRVSGEFAEIGGKGAEVATRETLLTLEFEGAARIAGGVPAIARAARTSEAEAFEARASMASRGAPSTARTRWREVMGEGPEVSAMRVTDVRGAGMASRPRHHVFPQEYRAFFEQRGFVGERSIDKFTVELEESAHQAIHGGGNFRLGRQWTGEWNGRIMGELTRIEREVNRQLTFEEIISVGEDLMNRYGIGQPFVPYR